MTTVPATKQDKGKTCVCGHAIWTLKGKVWCGCGNPRVWK